MRRTRIKMMAAVMAATMLLGGCGDALYVLTDDEENVIVNYAALSSRSTTHISGKV